MLIVVNESEENLCEIGKFILMLLYPLVSKPQMKPFRKNMLNVPEQFYIFIIIRTLDNMLV